jgi:hypothetical protein
MVKILVGGFVRWRIKGGEAMMQKLVRVLSCVLPLVTMVSVSAVADVNVLVVGSTRDSGELSWATGDSTTSPFNPNTMVTHLRGLLQAGSHGSVNVTFEERYRTHYAEWRNGDFKATFPAYNLASWYHFPFPAGNEWTNRWPNLRGELGVKWDYVVLIEDSYTVERIPGMYAQAVAMIGEEVAKGANNAQTVLLMTWPGPNSTSNIDHYKEVNYRIGRSGGYPVAPAGLAFRNITGLQKSSSSTHPDAKGAYIAAATLYSRLFNAQAPTTYNPGYRGYENDAAAAFNTVTSNVGQPQYTGAWDFPGHYQMVHDKRRTIHSQHRGSSTETGIQAKSESLVKSASARLTWASTPAPSAWNHGRDGVFSSSESSKSYRVDPARWTTAFGYTYQHRLEADRNHHGNDVFISFMHIYDNRLERHMRAQNQISAINVPMRTIWADFHRRYPNRWPVRDSYSHLEHAAEHQAASYMLTMFTGRTPISRRPSSMTEAWWAQKAGYEAAWRMSQLVTRAPGFKTLPSAATALKITPNAPETMEVFFVMKPRANVTVNISASDPTAITITPSVLTFTPENHDTVQKVVVSVLPGLSASKNVTISFHTESSDMVYDGLSDAWDYTAMPNSAPVANAQSVVALKDTAKEVTLTGSDVDGDVLTYAIVTGPAHGTLSGTGATRTYTPNAGYFGSDSFTFKVNDGTVDSASATVSIRVNAPPAANAGPDQAVTTGTVQLWTPAMIGSVAAWYDAADSSTITLASGVVSQWSDKSGNERHIAQATSTQRPGYTSGTSVNFDGSNDILFNKKSFMYASGSVDIYFVAAVNGASYDRRLIAESRSTSDSPLYAPVQSRNADDASRMAAYIRNDAGSILLANTVNLSATGAFNLATRKLYQMRDTGSQLSGRVNGGTATSGSYTRSGTMTMDSFGIGGIPPRPGYSTGSWWTRADMNEVVIVPSVLSDEDRQKLEGYLAHKWGMQANLPSGHPYKDAAPLTDGDTALVTLDGSGSTDLDGTIASYAWTLGSSQIATGVSPMIVLGVGVHNVTLAVTDNDGATDTDTVVITVTDGDEPPPPLNTAPVANDQSVTTAEDTAKAITLTGSDADGDPLTFAIVTSPVNGTLSGTAPNMTYTPSAGYAGSDSFTFKANDGMVDSAVATVSITVQAAPPAVPVVVDNTDSAQVTRVGTWTVSTWTGGGAFIGADYLHDGNSGKGTKSVTYRPELAAGVYEVYINYTSGDNRASNVPVTINYDGGSDTVTVNQRSGGGVWKLLGAYTFAAGTAGNVVISNAGTSGHVIADAIKFLPVEGTPPPSVNTVPVADAQSVTAAYNTATAITLTGSDADGDALTFVIVAGPANGVLSGAAPNVTYTPHAGYAGSDAFTFKVNDGTVDSDLATVSITVTPSPYRPADEPGSVVNGLNYAYYEGAWSLLPDFDALIPVAEGAADNFGIGLRLRDDNFGFVFTGYVEVLADGEYTFYTTSDDGSKLYIGDVEVVDNDGLHSARERSGVISLAAGLHQITVTFFERTGGERLEVRYAGPGVSKQLIPDNRLYHEKGQWTPDDLGTLTGWYDANETSTITVSSGKVSQWRDKSGSGLHLNQGTGSLQPTAGASLNGLDALRFSGNRMTTSSNPFGVTINDAFVIAVYRLEAVSNGSLFSLTGSTTTSRRWNAHAPWGDGRVYFDTGGASAPNRISTAYGVSAGSTVLSGFYGSTTDNVQQVFKNGSLLVSDSTGHAVSTVGNVVIGSDGSNNQNMTLGEIIVINGTVDLDARQRLEGYLAHKWGLVDQLPSDHPYKTAAP